MTTRLTGRTLFACAVAAFGCSLMGASAQAGQIFLTGHDPDFHAYVGGNTLGAGNINRRAISYILDPAVNTYYAGGVHKFLFVESRISPPGGHVNGVNGLLASGYAAGVDFDQADASNLNAALNQLGTQYSGIVVASDFGGVLTQAELDILNARAGDIANFVNSNGGLYAMAEGNGGAHLTPRGGWYGYIPVVASSTAFDQSEVGNAVTAFGSAIGLTNNDVNGNASHNIFTLYPAALNVVDFDSAGHALSLAGRVGIPAPSTLALIGVVALGASRRRR